MGVPASSPSRGDQPFFGKCEPALKSCQALGPEVRHSKGGGVGGRVPEDITEAQRLEVQERERATVTQGPGRPGLGVGARQEAFLSGRGPRSVPEDGRGPRGGVCRLWFVLLLLQPPQSTEPGHCLLHAQSASGLCGLDYRPSNHSGSLGLPTSVQNKVLRLLMIKMCPTPCPSAVGLTRRSVGF